MEARMDPCVLWARAFGVGAISFFLGVAGHVTADGLLPGPLFLTALLGLSVLLSVPVLNRPAGPLRLVAMLVGGQTVIHLVLSVTSGHRGDPGVTTAVARPTGVGSLPVVDGHRVGSLQDAYQGMAGQQPLSPTLPVGHLINDMSAHAPMMVAHLVAAALVGLWLARGERYLWTILALTGRRVLLAAWALVPARVAPTTLASYAAVRDLPGPRSLWLVRPASRRGPPLLAA
ncbi:hypothetical protein ABLE68_18355 [Nocardioides sp. CN2-186]|uniref:hypothetical protein n=1 Tax=Nocardioides tweenelious TaxID=3156607 RepID=UPI0032B5905A